MINPNALLKDPKAQAGVQSPEAAGQLAAQPNAQGPNPPPPQAAAQAAPAPQRIGQSAQTQQGTGFVNPQFFGVGRSLQQHSNLADKSDQGRQAATGAFDEEQSRVTGGMDAAIKNRDIAGLTIDAKRLLGLKGEANEYTDSLRGSRVADQLGSRTLGGSRLDTMLAQADPEFQARLAAKQNLDFTGDMDSFQQQTYQQAQAAKQATVDQQLAARDRYDAANAHNQATVQERQGLANELAELEARVRPASYGNAPQSAARDFQRLEQEFKAIQTAFPRSNAERQKHQETTDRYLAAKATQEALTRDRTRLAELKGMNLNTTIDTWDSGYRDGGFGVDAGELNANEGFLSLLNRRTR